MTEPSIEFDSDGNALIPESGMRFGPFPPESFFRIDGSALHNGIEKCCKVVDIVVVREWSGRGASLLLIEAKSTSPGPSSVPSVASAERGSESPDEQVDAYREKVAGSLHQLAALALGRHGVSHPDVPDQFREPAIMRLPLRFVLVIKKMPSHIDASLQDRVKARLKCCAKM